MHTRSDRFVHANDRRRHPLAREGRESVLPRTFHLCALVLRSRRGAAERGGDGADVPPRDELANLAMQQCLRSSGHGAAEHGDPTQHRLDERERLALPLRYERREIEGRQELARVRSVAQKANVSELASATFERAPLRPVSDDREHHFGNLRRRIDQRIDVLHRDETPRVADDESADGEPQRGAQLGAIRRRGDRGNPVVDEIDLRR